MTKRIRVDILTKIKNEIAAKKLYGRTSVIVRASNPKALEDLDIMWDLDEPELKRGTVIIDGEVVNVRLAPGLPVSDGLVVLSL